MSVQFDEEDKTTVSTHQRSGFIGFLIAHKIARDEKQATGMLLFVIVISFVAALVFMFIGLNSVNEALPIPDPVAIIFFSSHA